MNKEDAQKIMDCFVDLLIADYNSEKNGEHNDNFNDNFTSYVIIHLVRTDALHYLDRAKLLSGLDETFCVDYFDYATLIDCMYPTNNNKNV